MKKIHRRLSLFLNPESQDIRFNPNGYDRFCEKKSTRIEKLNLLKVPDLGKITEEKNNVGDNNEERDTFNEDIKETSSRVRLRKPKKKVSF